MRDTAGRTVAGLRFAALALRCGALLAAAFLLVGCVNTNTGTATGGQSVTSPPPGVDGSGSVNSADDADAHGADTPPGASDSDSDSVTGSGRLISRQLSVSGVTTLLVGASFVVRVTIGDPETATIRMDDNLTELVEATVSGDQLRLGLTPGASVRNATLSAEITVRSLEQLTASGASQATLVSAPAGQALELEASGASQITGPVRVDRLLAAASGASTLMLSGQAGYLDVRAAGTSALRLPELAVRDLDIVLSGASCAAVAVSDTLAARTSGVSTLRYLGAPRITRQQTSGTSSIAAGPPLDGRCGP